MLKSGKIFCFTLIAIISFSNLLMIMLFYNAGYFNKGSENSKNNIIDNQDVKISKISGKIHIIGNSGLVDFKNNGSCTGSGTYPDPYVIEDLLINGGGVDRGIWIENSNVFLELKIGLYTIQ